MVRLIGDTRSLDTRIEKLLKKHTLPLYDAYIQDKLDKQVRLPEKKESTKKAYRKHGWNTEDWFIRTGKGTKMEEVKNGVLRPKGYKYLTYVPRAHSFWVIDDKFKQILKDFLCQHI